LALEDDIRLLSSVDLFSELGSEQLRLLAFGSETLSLKAGQDLYAEGDHADGAYVVVSGRIVLYRKRDDGRHVIETCTTGDILGELALIAQTDRLTSAAAETDADLIRLNRALFRRILEEYPEIAIRLHARVSAQLQELLHRIQSLAPKFG
jgi:CRP-like cAMP-binding protein